MAKVSVLVPIYNVEKYLRECLESLVNQTLTDIEIICINDGSTDSSLSIIEEFSSKDSRIKIINKENSGYGASMNQGLKLASGDYVAILESDDFTDVKMLEELYTIAKNNDLDVVISDFYCYWTDSGKIKKSNKIKRYKHNKILNIKSFPYLLRNKSTIWSAIYKRELLSKFDIKFLETPGASYQDTSFRIKTLSAASKVYVVPKAYVRYRQDNMNSSVKSKGKVFILCDEYKEIESFMNKYPEIKKYAIDEVMINKWHGYLWNMGRIDNEFVDEFVDKFQQEFKCSYEANELSKAFYKNVGKNKLNKLLNEKDVFKTYIRDIKGKSLCKKFKFFLQHGI